MRDNTLQGFFEKFKVGPPAQPGHAYLPLVRFMLDEVRGTDILDLGGGQGAYSLELKKAGYDPVVADVNARSLQVAHAHGLKSRLLDADEKPGTQIADTVLLFEVLEHVDEPESLLHSALQAARQRVLLTVPCSEFFDDLFALGLSFAHMAVTDHKHHFSESGLRTLLNQCGCRYRIQCGDPLFPHASLELLKRSWRWPWLGFLCLLPVRLLNRLGGVRKTIPSRFYVVCEKN